jgi:N-acetylglucosamine-6-sulfatase
MHGEHRIASGKLAVYESSERVPLCVLGPGFAAASSVAIPVSMTDLAPTLVQLAGATAGRIMDGRSLSDATSGGIGADRAVLMASGTDTTTDRR